MKVQAFLRSGGTLDQLAEQYAVKAKRHGQFPNIVLLKYDQINSPFREPLVQECRGVILDEADGWRCVARAFDKFFNYGEGFAAPVDWTTATVQEKLDGSLCTLYWHAGAWQVATSGTPDASGQVNDFGITFRELFWRTVEAQGLRLPPKADRCWAFELCAPQNRVIVRHGEARLTLIGVRRLEDMREEKPAEWADHFPAVRSFGLGSMDEVLATFATLDPLKQEGYVVCDADFRRVKVKHPGYVALHNMKGGPLTNRRLVEVVRSGEVGEVLTYFPEWAERLGAVKAALDNLTTEMLAHYERLRAIPEQKAFALEATKTRCAAVLFQMRAGKVTHPAAFWAKLPIKNLVALLNLTDNEPEVET